MTYAGWYLAKHYRLDDDEPITASNVEREAEKYLRRLALVMSGRMPHDAYGACQVYDLNSYAADLSDDERDRLGALVLLGDKPTAAERAAALGISERTERRRRAQEGKTGPRGRPRKS